jgi:hypothetical protein
VTDLICRCDGILHALDGAERQRARRALDRAQGEGKHRTAARIQDRLDQCPTTVLTVQERPA